MRGFVFFLSVALYSENTWSHVPAILLRVLFRMPCKKAKYLPLMINVLNLKNIQSSFLNEFKLN